MIPKLFFNNLHSYLHNFFNVNTEEKLDTLDDMLEFINNQKIVKKLIFVIDDFQNLLKIDKNALSKISSYWSKKLKNKNIQLILSSSIYSSAIKDRKIYEKASEIIFLKSLDIHIIKEIIKDVPRKDIMYIYAAFGTNPNYLIHYDINKDFINYLPFILFI